MSRIRDLVRPHIRELDPYPPGKPVKELERELGIEGSIKLGSNESPLGPSRRAIEAIFREAEELNRYPDGSSYYLREALTATLGVEGSQLLFGAGSDELLEILVKTFLGPGDEAVYAWPSFAMYPIVTAGMGGTAVAVELDDAYRADVGRLLEAVGERTRLLFLANPNNPTGTSIGQADFERLIRELPGQRLAQVEARPVRVAVELLRLLEDRLHGAPRRPERRLVRGQLDHVLDTELALELFDRLARRVRLQLADVRADQVADLHGPSARG